jgi:diguanylate cyclase (GGDEF)-like protein
MVFIRRNIWLAFYLVVILLTAVAAGGLYLSYQQIYQEHAMRQSNITRISANSLSASFAQYETILDILASQVQLVHEDSPLDVNSVFMRAVERDPTIASISLSRLDGNIELQVPHSDLPVMMTQEPHWSSFRDAMDSSKMVVGRTYYDGALNNLVIPFRKAVLNSQGQAAFVMSLSIDLKQGFDYFINKVQDTPLSDTYLFREHDRYFQIAPSAQVYLPQVYQYQVPQADIEASIVQLERVTGQPYRAIKQSGEVHINEIQHPSRRSQSAGVYLPDYKVWVSTETDLSHIQQQFLDKVVVFVFLYFLSLLIMFLMFRNIARAEARQRAALDFQANHDYLTKLRNRYYLDRYFESRSSDKPFTLVAIDVDRFKVLNDSYGHSFGDRVIKQIGARLRQVITADDVALRLGGDEFLIVTSSVTLSHIEQLCERTLHVLCQPYRHGESEVLISVSMAVSRYPNDGDDPAQILKNIDLSMNKAKLEKGRIYYYDKSLLDEVESKLQIEQQLKQALDNQEFFLTYQPQMTLDNQLKGIEALIRWNNPTLGFVSPAEFISVAEATGYMNQIGSFVIREALDQIGRVKRELGVSFDLSINISVKQLQSPSFYDDLVAAIESTQFDRHSLLLEITESLFIDNVEETVVLLTKLKEQGIRVSLDDFGTGYSSLSMLRKLPIDELKLDRSFSCDLLEDGKAYAMVEGVVNIAHHLGLKTVAEGVESSQTVNCLSHLGNDLFQGYYFAKPLELSDLIQFIQQHADDSSLALKKLSTL